MWEGGEGRGGRGGRGEGGEGRGGRERRGGEGRKGCEHVIGKEVVSGYGQLPHTTAHPKENSSPSTVSTTRCSSRSPSS